MMHLITQDNSDFLQQNFPLSDKQTMELRAEVRIAVDEPVKVTLLTHPDRQIDGVVADVSGRGMRILLANAVPLKAAIRMDFDHAILLGEVCRCAPHHGGFAIGIRLCHSLIGLDQLAKVRARFLHDRLLSR